MPRKRTAYKELRKAKHRHFKNISTVSELKTLIKKFEKLVAEKKAAEAKGFIGLVSSKIDKAVTKGVLHKNNASRRKSRLMKKLSLLSKA